VFFLQQIYFLWFFFKKMLQKDDMTANIRFALRNFSEY